MLLHAAAGVVLIDLGEAEAQELLPLVRRQAVEGFVGARQMRRQRDAEAAQQLRAVDAGSDGALLELGRDRRPVHGGGKAEKVDGIVGRHRDDVVRAFDLDVRHRKGDEHGHVLVRPVEEAVMNPDLLG